LGFTTLPSVLFLETPALSWYLFLRAGFQAFFAEEAAAARRKQQGEAANEVFRSEFRNFVSGGGRAETEMHPAKLWCERWPQRGEGRSAW